MRFLSYSNVVIRRVLLVALFVFSSHHPALANAQVQEAFAYVDSKRWDQALSTIRKTGNERLHSVVTWYYLTRTDRMPAQHVYARFIDQHPDWPDMEKLKTRAEISLFSNPYTEGEVANWFNRHPPMTARGRYEHARLNNTLNDGIIIDAWIHGNFRESDEKLFLERHSKTLGTAHHVARANRLLWEGKTGAAQRILSKLPADQKALATARIGLIKNQNSVNGLIDKVPASLRQDPGLIYNRMTWRAKRRDYGGVLEMLQLAPAAPPYPAKWWSHRNRAIRDALEKKNYTLAYSLASRHGQTIDSRYELSEALWLHGWIGLVFMNKPSEAFVEFKRMYDVVNYPVSKSRAAYWAGRAAKAVGNSGEASRWFGKSGDYPYTFYGQLSLQENHSSPRLSIPSPSPIDSGRVKRLMSQNSLAGAVGALGDAGVIEYAMPLLAHLVETSRSENDARSISYIGNYYRRPDISLKTAKEAIKRDWLITETAFPTYSLPSDTAVEPALALAITRQESSFYPRAISPAGARGMMQLMPRTAQITAKKHQFSYATDKLYDPTYNIRLGSRYLANLVDRFSGSYFLASAGYNAGPGRPDSWQRAYGAPGGNLYQTINWIEMIPFSETRNYVQRVMENYHVYNQLLGAEKPLDINGTLKR